MGGFDRIRFAAVWILPCWHNAVSRTEEGPDCEVCFPPSICWWAASSSSMHVKLSFKDANLSISAPSLWCTTAGSPPLSFADHSVLQCPSKVVAIRSHPTKKTFLPIDISYSQEAPGCAECLATGSAKSCDPSPKSRLPSASLFDPPAPPAMNSEISGACGDKMKRSPRAEQLTNRSSRDFWHFLGFVDNL